MATDELTLSKALDAECRRHEADVLTILAAAARLVAASCITGGMATSPREQVAQTADRFAEVFLRVLAAHLAHAGVKLQAPLS